jgi:putative phage-type endonuclease
MPHIDKREMSQEEWLKARQLGIGASEIAAVLGLDDYMTAYQVWQEKISEQATALHDNLCLFMGREMEEPIAKWYTHETKRRRRRDNKIRIHESLPLLANLDRIALPTDEERAQGIGPGILECKTVGLLAKGKWDQGFPNKYYLQIQQQLMVLGENYKWADLAVVVGGNVDFQIFRIEPDPRIFELIDKEAKVFWEFVKNRVPPPMKPTDFAGILPIPASSVEATNEVLIAHSISMKARAQKKLFDAIAESNDEIIKQLLGDKELLIYQGDILATWKATKGGLEFDEERFGEDAKEIYAEYLIPKKPSRRFYIKEVETHVKAETITQTTAPTDSASGGDNKGPSGSLQESRQRAG